MARLPDGRRWVQAFAESLEDRICLSTFQAFVSGTKGDVHTNTFSINVWTTGALASTWTVNWGDNSTPDSFSGSSSVITRTHNYIAGTYKITATATPSSGPGSTATYGLMSAFGTTSGSANSMGETVTTPSGSSGAAGGAAMVVDTSGGTYNGYVYVVSADGSDAAVTRFTPSGGADGTFGNSSTPGTFLLSGLGSGTATSIAITSDGRYVAIAGQFNGWGAALIDTHGGTGGSGSISWQDSGLVSTGKANALTFDSSDVGGPYLYLAGQVAGTGVNASCDAVAQVNLSGGGLCCGFSTCCSGICIFVPSGSTCGYATGIIDLDGEGLSIDDLAICGYVTYAGGADFTLVELNDSGTTLSSITRTNFGSTMGSSNGAINIPSSDFATSLTVHQYDSDIVVAGYTNATSSSNHVALAEYSPTTLGLTSFGPYSDGVSVGPAGQAYSIVQASVNSGTLVVGGSYNNDFLACQFTHAGSLDSNNFGTGGIFEVDLGNTSSNSNDVAYSIGVETDGSIMLGGSSTPSGGSAKIALVDLLDNPSITMT